MADVHICLATNKDVAVLAVQVCEEVKSEDYRAVRAVLERHNTTVRAPILYGGEDIFDGSLWCESMCFG